MVETFGASLQKAALHGEGKSVILFYPPLVITKQEAGKGLDIFEESVKKVSFNYK